ncbi:hypothetical protein EV121DRAFT_274811 [Schizophyllum commune]
MCVLVGRPPAEDWQERQLELAAAMHGAAERMSFAHADEVHRRGNYRLKSHGLSHGGGQKFPRPLKHRPVNKKELDSLLDQPAAKQLAHLCSSAFKQWEPDVHAYYEKTMDALFEWKPVLRHYKNFPKSVFACMTANLGPQTVTIPHRDFGNLCFGFCSITALGSFNPDLGGQLYTAGAIFRFVEHGCQSNDQYYSTLTADQYRAAIAADKTRAQEGRARLSTLPELRARAAAPRK